MWLLRRIYHFLFIVYFCLAEQKFVDDRASQTMLSDIKSAFKLVTNNTNVLNSIIPQMYSGVMKNPMPKLVFKLPDVRHKGDYTMLQMPRSVFATPIFPNISTHYMKMMQKRRKQGAVAYKATTKDASSSGNNHNKHEDDWSLLGLDGWVGEISQPIKMAEWNYKDSIGTTTTPGINKNEYPATEILVDFIVGDTFANDADKPLTTPDSKETLKMEQLDENIYIARVNDPFGQSTKWELRNTTEDRPKRDIVTLYSMIRCSTGCDPLMYKAYGCFCGFGGSGLPINGIDRCCKFHDKCYEQTNCISYLEYFVPYIWKCYRGKPVCALDHGEWGGPASCAARLCYCDLQLSRCLRNFACPRRRAICETSTARKLQNLIFF